jgi:hypothetical protein
VLRDQEGQLSFLVHPELHAVVQDADLEYLERLTQDFRERAKLDPDALFKQLSYLNVGPLVTSYAGPTLSEYPNVYSLCSSFVLL